MADGSAKGRDDISVVPFTASVDYCKLVTNVSRSALISSVAFLLEPMAPSSVNAFGLARISQFRSKLRYQFKAPVNPKWLNSVD